MRKLLVFAALFAVVGAASLRARGFETVPTPFGPVEKSWGRRISPEVMAGANAIEPICYVGLSAAVDEVWLNVVSVIVDALDRSGDLDAFAALQTDEQRSKFIARSAPKLALYLSRRADEILEKTSSPLDPRAASVALAELETLNRYGDLLRRYDPEKSHLTEDMELRADDLRKYLGRFDAAEFGESVRAKKAAEVLADRDARILIAVRGIAEASYPHVEQIVGAAGEISNRVQGLPPRHQARMDGIRALFRLAEASPGLARQDLGANAREAESIGQQASEEILYVALHLAYAGDDFVKRLFIESASDNALLRGSKLYVATGTMAQLIRRAAARSTGFPLKLEAYAVCRSMLSLISVDPASKFLTEMRGELGIPNINSDEPKKNSLPAYLDHLSTLDFYRRLMIFSGIVTALIGALGAEPQIHFILLRGLLTMGASLLVLALLRWRALKYYVDPWYRKFGANPPGDD